MQTGAHYLFALQPTCNAGDWFKVEKLVRETGGDDSQLVNAWNKIGQYYSDRHKWVKAAEYYTQVSRQPAYRLSTCVKPVISSEHLGPWPMKDGVTARVVLAVTTAK